MHLSSLNRSKISPLLRLCLLFSLLTFIFTACSTPSTTSTQQTKEGTGALTDSFKETNASSSSPEVTEEDSKKIKVIASIYPLFDFAEKIGQDKIELISLSPNGVDPHSWEPSPKELIQLNKADVFIYNGLQFEPWVDSVLASWDNKQAITVNASSQIKISELVESDHIHEENESKKEHQQEEHGDEGIYDPHVWLHPILAKQQMQSILEAFIHADPKNADFYQANFQTYAKEFDLLFEEFENGLKNLKNREIIVTHKAFGNLCEAFNLKQTAIEGLADHSEPDAATMAKLIDYMKKENIPVVFFEAGSSSKVADAIAKETKAVTAMLYTLESVGQKELQKGEDYFSLMRYNLATLTKNLTS